MQNNGNEDVPKKKKRARTDEHRRIDRERKRITREIRKRAKEQWLIAGGRLEDWDTKWGAPNLTVKQLTDRIDQRLKGDPTSPEMKVVIGDAVERYFDKNIKEIAKAVGLPTSSVQRIVAEDPSRLSRLAAKKEALTLDNLRTGLLQLATQFREAVEDGRLEPTGKNVSALAIAFGIWVDKVQLISGGATERREDIIPGRTFEEQKQNLIDSLDEAGRVLEVITGGKG